MRKVAGAVIALRGWRRVILATAAGVLSALAMAPWFAFPVLWVSLPVLVWLIDGSARTRRIGDLAAAAIVGWSFGFGYFVAGLWWIGAAFFVEADRFAWLMPVAVIGLPAYLALFWALGTATARLLWSESSSRILVFATALSLAEWLRGHALTGFPWNAFGYALVPTPTMMQSAALVGLWGLTLAAFVVFAAPAALVPVGGAPRSGGRLLVGFALTLFVAHAAFGVVRLAGTADQVSGGTRLRIVQPAIPQDEKWLDDNADAIFALQLELSETGSGPEDDPIERFDLVVWPESAFPFYLDERQDALVALADLLPMGTTLISGAARLPTRGGGETDRVFNSILVIGDEGEVIDGYDKVHLVPFGEYLPFQSALESIGLRQLTGVPGGFAAGPGRRTIPLANAPAFGPLICYEIVFPGAATEAGRRPGWLLNVTNDAWYGDTPGPRQHFHQARLRAVEEGLPLVRAANTGISAILDAYGNVIASLGVDEMGVVDGFLPATGSPTLYSRYGDLTFWISALGILCTATINRLNKGNYGNRQK
jgi:apolipoprotein N-acyltransferase